MKKCLIIGSVAFDILFDIHGRIQDEILIQSGKLGRQNLMFTAKEKRQFFGGTAGNIAYGLGLLKEKPLLFSVVGKDFDGEYAPHLKHAGVDTRVVKDREGFSATFYGMNDKLGQQIGVYQPNAYAKADTTSLFSSCTKKDLKEVTVAIFSAGTEKSIYKNMSELRKICKNNVQIIFDPGQVLSIFYDKKSLERTLALSDIFIGNEVEVEQLQSILGYSIERILEGRVSTVIRTLGAKGSFVYTKESTLTIKPVKPKKVVETTGAGDAYRAGLISGLLQGKSLELSCALGAKLGSRSVEKLGAQTYKV